MAVLFLFPGTQKHPVVPPHHTGVVFLWEMYEERWACKPYPPILSAEGYPKSEGHPSCPAEAAAIKEMLEADDQFADNGRGIILDRAGESNGKSLLYFTKKTTWIGNIK